MSEAAPLRAGRVSVWLRLGRVSNLPTVWTNTLAGVLLGGATCGFVALLIATVLMSTFYVAGMILNDVFDAEHDAVHRPSRPIPSGLVTRASALRVGVTGLVAAVFGVGVLAHQLERPVLGALGLATALAAAIVAYDAHHKANPLGPVVMGICRGLVYLTAAWAVSGQLTAVVVVVASLQCSYVVGLTYAAKQEDLVRPGSFWPALFVLAPPLVVAMSWSDEGKGLGLHHGQSSSMTTIAGLALMLGSIAYGLAPLLWRKRQIGLAVGRLIAGIAVLDAMVLATAGWAWGAAVALAGAVLTRVAQRIVPGT